MRYTVTLALLATGLVRGPEVLLAQSIAPVQLSADLVGELRKGKTALRQIGWTPGAGELEQGAGAAFSDALAKLALALREAGGSYRADFYVEPLPDKTKAERIAAARFAALRDALDHAGLPDDVVVAGTVKVERDVRLELVRVER